MTRDGHPRSDAPGGIARQCVDASPGRGALSGNYSPSSGRLHGPPGGPSTEPSTARTRPARSSDSTALRSSTASWASRTSPRSDSAGDHAARDDRPGEHGVEQDLPVVGRHRGRDRRADRCCAGTGPSGRWSRRGAPRPPRGWRRGGPGRPPRRRADLGHAGAWWPVAMTSDRVSRPLRAGSEWSPGAPGTATRVPSASVGLSATDSGRSSTTRTAPDSTETAALHGSSSSSRTFEDRRTGVVPGMSARIPSPL